MGFPKRPESVRVARSTITPEAGVRVNIVATAKFVVVEMWLVPCERKVIQRATLNGKIKAQYTAG